MAEKNPVGPTGQTVAANIERLRKKQGLSYAELSRKLDEIGYPIAVLGLSNIEKRKRRVDVDDLMALAVALGVNPNTLLLPATVILNQEVLLTGGGWVDAADAHQWANGQSVLKFTDFFPMPTGTMKAQREEWNARRQFADEDFRHRINPNMVSDPGPNVRTIEVMHDQQIGYPDGDD